jgi:hypothetical protein
VDHDSLPPVRIGRNISCIHCGGLCQPPWGDGSNCRPCDGEGHRREYSLGQLRYEQMVQAGSPHELVSLLRRLAGELDETEAFYRQCGQPNYGDIVSTEAACYRVISRALLDILERGPRPPAAAQAKRRRWLSWLPWAA